MPDNCDNDLDVVGPLFNVEIFLIEHVAEYSMVLPCEGGRKRFYHIVPDFDTIIPYPEPFRSLDKRRPWQGFNQGGHEWCVANWGTKWNAYNGDNSDYNQLPDGRTSVHLFFETALSPPSKKLMLTLSRLHPGLEFTLRFSNADGPLRGRLRVRRGRVLDEWYTNRRAAIR